MAINGTEEITLSVSSLIAGLIAICLCSIHVYNTVSDVCGKRKSVSHRVTEPALTTRYKLVSVLTLICVILYTFTVVFGLVYVYLSNADMGTNGRKSMILLGFATYMPAKAIMYIVFMYRLHMCYSESTYGYSQRFIYCMVGLNAVIGLVLSIVLIIVTEQIFAQHAALADDELPNATAFIITMGVFFLWDVIMNIMSLSLFIHPLRKTWNAMKVHNGDSRITKMTDKMMYIAVKYAILTAVASLSTLVFISLGFVGTAGTILAPFDYVVNCVALMLMTAYYPDDRYYENLCCLCLLCCPRGYRKYKSKASKGPDVRKAADPETKDTAEAHRYIDASSKRESQTIPAPSRASTAMTEIQPSGQTEADVIYEVTPDPSTDQP